MSDFVRIQPPVYPVDRLNIPDARCVRLNPGIPVFLIEAGMEEIMRIEFTFKAGHVHESRPLLSSTTNQMLTEGSENYSAEQINSLFDFYGAFINTAAERDRAGVVVYLLNKHAEKVIALCREILFHPVFPEEELMAHINKRLHWYRINMEKVSNLAADQFFESIFGPDHPYGRKVTVEDFAQINRPLVSSFHARYYSPSNMAIIISGKIPEGILDILNNLFGDLSSGTISYGTLPETGFDAKPGKIHIEKAGSLQTAIRIGSRTINKKHPDYPGLKFVDTILGGYFGSRLMKNIREKKGYTYGISSAVSSLELSGYYYISTETGSRYTANTIEEIYREIASLQRMPVGNDELNVVRNYMSGEMVRMFDGPFALAESFRSAWDFGLDNSYFYRLAEKIRTIGADEVMELAGKYYRIDEMSQVTAGQI